jgi:hypothetical protein
LHNNFNFLFFFFTSHHFHPFNSNTTFQTIFTFTPSGASGFLTGVVQHNPFKPFFWFQIGAANAHAEHLFNIRLT